MAKSKKEPELAPLPEPVATTPVVESESVEAADQSAKNALGSATDNEAGAAPIAPASTQPEGDSPPMPIEYSTFIASYPAHSDEGHFHAAALERALVFFGCKLKRTEMSDRDGKERTMVLEVVVTR